LGERAFVEATKNQPQVTFDTKGPLGVDRVSGAQVSCRVSPSGAKFTVSANIVGPVPSTSNPTAITVQIPAIGPGESGASGTVAISDDRSGGLTYTSSTCSFTARADGLGTGKIWASVSCTNAQLVGTLGANCDITPAGFFVFENCAE
jgi:hypothetical protein